MRRGFLVFPTLLSLSVASSFATRPAEAQPGDLRAGFTLANDYVSRGYSRAEADLVVQAGVRFRHRSGFVAGLWGSTVRFELDEIFDDPRRLEVHGFAGYATALGRWWSGSVTVARYEHPGADLDTSYTEASVSLEYRDLLLATIAYAPDYLGSGRSGSFAEASGRVPLAFGLDATAGVGHVTIDLPTVSGYVYGHAGLGASVRRFRLELGYYFSDSPEIPSWGEAVDGRWVLGASTHLP